MLVKVCGMREAENIHAIESLKIDFMGFIFYPKSPRYVKEKPDYLPVHCQRVGVFVNASKAEILNRTKDFDLDFVQLHGDESPEQCAALKAEGLQVIKAFPIGQDYDWKNTCIYKGVADYFLFDTACPSYGGSGRRFDWKILKDYSDDTPFLLSGGIRPERLNDVLAFHHPMLAGIDLNSGFETSPGMKDVSLLNEFVNNLKKESL
ncbi:MAG: phosphoribosylanthranilate isomerase [Bacteroidaceae bacterium]|nr:phosphoribosylanthranilate isomerase [Bacteroidaceae bacterium]